MNRAFYGFAIAVVVLMGAAYYAGLYGSQTEESAYVYQGGVNERDEDGKTPLLRAAIDGNSKAIKALLKAGADIEARDTDGDATALIFAVMSGHTEVVRELLKVGADTEARDRLLGGTTLMWAAFIGHTEVIRELLNAGADIEAKSAFGQTALIYAATVTPHASNYDNKAKAIRILLKAGANKYAQSREKMTAFDYWTHLGDWRGFGITPPSDFYEIARLLKP